MGRGASSNVDGGCTGAGFKRLVFGMGMVAGDVEVGLGSYGLRSNRLDRQHVGGWSDRTLGVEQRKQILAAFVQAQGRRLGVAELNFPEPQPDRLSQELAIQVHANLIPFAAGLTENQLRRRCLQILLAAHGHMAIEVERHRMMLLGTPRQGRQRLPQEIRIGVSQHQLGRHTAGVGHDRLDLRKPTRLVDP